MQKPHSLGILLATALYLYACCWPPGFLSDFLPSGNICNLHGGDSPEDAVEAGPAAHIEVGGGGWGRGGPDLGFMGLGCHLRVSWSSSLAGRWCWGRQLDTHTDRQADTEALG